VEQHVRRIYNRVSPIDSSSPAGPITVSQDNVQVFSISVPSPQTHALSIGWTVDGAVVAGGPQFLFTADQFAIGAHTVAANVADSSPFVRSDPARVLRTSRSWSVQVTPDIGMRMSLDAPGNGASVGRPFTISGWALNVRTVSGTGIDAIHVYAAPSSGPAIFLGVAAYGDARPDVGAIFGSRFTDSGFTLSAGTSLVPGSYTVTAYAHNAISGAFDALRSATVTVTAPVSHGLLNIDSPGAGAIVTSAFEVGGWAIDTGAPSGSGVDAVQFYIFPNDGASPGVFIGTGSYGSARTDVGSAFGSRFTNSGFHFTITGLGPARFLLGVYARSTLTGTFSVVNTVHVTVNANALMSIDAPSPEMTVTTSSFSVAGWAIDRAVEGVSSTGTGVDAQHVYAYHNPGSGEPAIFLGVATLGFGRPDVGALYGSRYDNSGYNLDVNAASAGLLPGGVYNIVVFAHSTVTDSFNNLAVVRVTIQ
jgi:hypothetical protein